MTRIHYVDPDGNTTTLDVPEGQNLMQAAVQNGIDGIVGECGGSLVCATCHCYVDPNRLSELNPPTEEELELLDEVAAQRKENSRLSCQIKACASLDDLSIAVPETQY
ncbi:MAG TPA: ferredoxin [Pusillimonas sp.]|jgi:2Fe-2S ferredoxin|nr:ferredoxin [Pusillimonas sp.]HBT33081.1 ferredoxin [Pusillimonas sp.]HCP78451.1 ferredoxin [Pusillimonas sp.]|tara:strand:+ start:297771 stop:298094 length:324 start_codon:yes stop_codon:yes gene_type:complete